MSTERETKFSGFAKLLYDKMRGDIAGLLVAIGSPLATKQQEIDFYERMLQQTIAQGSYDLAVHILTQQLTEDHYRFPEQAAQETLQSVVTDLTDWPAN